MKQKYSAQRPPLFINSVLFTNSVYLHSELRYCAALQYYRTQLSEVWKIKITTATKYHPTWVEAKQTGL
jgi:hypothetical protein